MLTCILLFHLLGNSLAGYLDLGMALNFPLLLIFIASRILVTKCSYFNTIVLISVQIA
jgi:hypothetical protein